MSKHTCASCIYLDEDSFTRDSGGRVELEWSCAMGKDRPSSGRCEELTTKDMAEAAPDLLSALKALLAQAEAHIAYPCPEIDAAREAVRKAGGE